MNNPDAPAVKREVEGIGEVGRLWGGQDLDDFCEEVGACPLGSWERWFSVSAARA